MGQHEEELLRHEHLCNLTVLNQPPPNDGRLYCDPYWDTWGCWNYTLAGTNAVIPCPSHQPGFDPSLTAYRTCSVNGTWWTHPVTNRTWSNYTTCVNHADLAKDKRVINVFIAGYTVSILFLIASLLIFTFFKQLQCDRVTIHKHLFTSYIFNGAVWILYYTTAAMDAQVQANNPVWCQAVHVITQYFVTCNFFWMFCEGLYLHTIIVVAFSTGKKLLICCYVLGWVLPIFITALYTAARALSPDEAKACWLHESTLQWIVAGPIVLTIVINFIFLCNIVRVLVTKLRSVNSPDTNGYRKAVRATLILIPLLGLQFILFPLRPEENTTWDEIYMLVSAVVTSCQGLFVAVIFCFLNGEVHTVIKRRWNQHRMMTQKALNPRGSFYTQTSMADPPPYPGRRSSQSPRASFAANDDRRVSRSIFKSKPKASKNGSSKASNGCHYSLAAGEPSIEGSRI
ncbi:hypothetical protein CAPTEDRAFT_221530 [Capitella teleta]|uniref:Calcitonin receptor n=1 Tax=Capitella teleta TaxID=283909 RepID=R7T7Q8_CAPTE|nr:hypothetical protein CAPTEDRAFT_221530 [Capitella teleta]|eukprot:ELT89684.1 hypothetical protein CAPTEDRAFT_221530 [Capitella teleta]